MNDATPDPRPSGTDPMERGLAALRSRWTRVRGVRLSLQILFYALLCGAVIALVFPDLPAWALVASLVVAALVTGTVGAFLARPGDATLAKEFDDRAGLLDRVSSAVELSAERSPMIEALREDARAASARLVPAEVVPMQLPREGYWMPVPVLLLAGAVAFGGSWNTEPQQDPALAETIEERIAELEELLSREEGERDSERKKELREMLERLKLELKPDETDKKDAMEEIARLKEELQRQQDAEAEKERELQRMLQELKPGEKDSQLEDALQRGDHADAMKRLKEMKEELEQKLKEKKEELTEEELAELEELLKKLEEIEAQLMKLMQLNMDMQVSGEVLEFLEAFEGELADLTDFDVSKVLKLEDLEPPSP